MKSVALRENEMRIFDTVAEAIHAGYEILSPIPDSEGNLHARTKADDHHYALALVRMHR